MTDLAVAAELGKPDLQLKCDVVCASVLELHQVAEQFQPDDSATGRHVLLLDQCLDAVFVDLRLQKSQNRGGSGLPNLVLLLCEVFQSALFL